MNAPVYADYRTSMGEVQADTVITMHVVVRPSAPPNTKKAAGARVAYAFACTMRALVAVRKRRKHGTITQHVALQVPPKVSQKRRSSHKDAAALLVS